MSASVNVAIIQPATHRLDLDGNLARIERLVIRVARHEARIAYTPECAVDGYSFHDPSFQANPRRYCISSKDLRNAWFHGADHVRT